MKILVFDIWRLQLLYEPLVLKWAIPESFAVSFYIFQYRKVLDKGTSLQQGRVPLIPLVRLRIIFQTNPQFMFSITILIDLRSVWLYCKGFLLRYQRASDFMLYKQFILVKSIEMVVKGIKALKHQQAEKLGYWLWDHQRWEIPDTLQGDPFSLYEDIFIIYQMFRRSPQTFLSTYKYLANFTLAPREAESIKKRYNRHIARLTPQMIESIIAYIDSEGKGGYKYLVIRCNRVYISDRPLYRGPKGGWQQVVQQEMMDIEGQRESHVEQVPMRHQQMQREMRMSHHLQQVRMGQEQESGRRMQQYSIIVNDSFISIKTTEFDELVEGSSGNVGLLLDVLGNNNILKRNDLHWTRDQDELLMHAFGKYDYKSLLEPLTIKKKVGYLLPQRMKYLKSTKRWTQWQMSQIAVLMRSYEVQEFSQDYRCLLFRKGERIVQEKVRWLKKIGRWRAYDESWCDQRLIECRGNERNELFSAVAEKMGRDLARQRVFYLKKIGRM